MNGKRSGGRSFLARQQRRQLGDFQGIVHEVAARHLFGVPWCWEVANYHAPIIAACGDVEKGTARAALSAMAPKECRLLQSGI
jgi:hypothetical protein